ncbi:DUF4249 domain-containing protein [Maribellus sediminis]|uniref:DUF4249 domain-containing protein n=1 Tax=Maribellus sediminis TaxID=2696285 RepID=UPI001430143E|nr:DUF4249 domain-containing protein [Maribellus sediminis]
MYDSNHMINIFYFLYAKRKNSVALYNIKTLFRTSIWLKICCALFVIWALQACLEPFSASVGDEASNLLVVDGLISNENTAYQVRLTRAVANINEDITLETGANVIIEDDLGNMTAFTETEDGIYETNENNFIGVPGRTYTLQISTKNGRVYRSDACMMKPATQIDSIYYVPGNHPDSVAESYFTGLRVFINGKVNAEDVEYLRWAYDEDWKFAIPFGYDEVPTPDGDWEKTISKKYCWKSEVSNEILIQNFGGQSQKNIEGKELFFVDSKNTDKLFQRYSVLIKQYSITKEEYEYWRKLEQTNPDVNNIFGEQPFTIQGNIKNEADPDEKVLGYFSVVSAATRRLYIDYSEIRYLQLPVNDYYNSCGFDSLMVKDLNMSVYEIYENYILNDFYEYVLAFPILHENPFIDKVIGLAVSTPQCCDCTLQGELNPPDFWEDE